jgi:hypothetical protein
LKEKRGGNSKNKVGVGNAADMTLAFRWVLGAELLV